jgi:hypothetical protein
MARGSFLFDEETAFAVTAGEGEWGTTAKRCDLQREHQQCLIVGALDRKHKDTTIA